MGGADAAAADSSIPPTDPPDVAASEFFDDDPNEVSLVSIDRAVERLAESKVLRPDEYYAVTASARGNAFTITTDVVNDATDKFRRNVLTDLENITDDGPSLRGFRKRVLAQYDELPISDAHMEQVYRNTLNESYSQGQEHVLDNSLVVDEFPYREYTAIHDARVRDEHEAMESHGIDGTAVYHRLDPVWQRFRPPWDWNCRCGWIALTIEDAARRGVREAKAWLRDGIEPPHPRVSSPPFSPDPAWDRGTVQFAEFDESKITRDAGGKFGSGGGGGAEPEKEPAKPKHADEGSKIKTGDYALDDDVPVSPGTSPIPDDHIRFFHYSTVRDKEAENWESTVNGHAASLRGRGISMSGARGEKYGEPNQIWASRGIPENIERKVVVEFSLPHDDPRIGGTIGRRTGSVEEIQNDKSDATFTGDITPDEIVAVHEPWHHPFREMQDEDMIGDAGAGKFDWSLKRVWPDEVNEFAAAVRRAKMVHDREADDQDNVQLAAEFDESKITRDEDGKFGSGGGGGKESDEWTDEQEQKFQAWEKRRTKLKGHTLQAAYSGFSESSAQGISKAKQAEYMENFESVLDKMSDTSLNRLRMMVHNDGSFGWHRSTADLTKEHFPEMIGTGKEVGGFFQYEYPKKVVLDGAGVGLDSQGIYAHELGHALDHSFGDERPSQSAEWLEIWEDTITDNQLTAYASTDVDEGFCEFYRLLISHEGTARLQFPRAHNFFRDLGLVQKEKPWA